MNNLELSQFEVTSYELSQADCAQKIAYFSHAECSKHEMTSGHHESPSRLRAIEKALKKSPVKSCLTRHNAPLASHLQLARAHDHEYVKRILSLAPKTGLVILGMDTAMNPHSVRAARRAAGAVVAAVDVVMKGETKIAFCSVRPPGHHAERRRAKGFCFFNNVAVGAAHALHMHGLERVTIVDFDLHHGNGTEDIFRFEPRVQFLSTFQHMIFPYSGHDTVSDHIHNIALTPGTTGSEFRNKVLGSWADHIDNFKPQLLLISAGFDAHQEEPMAGLHLVEDDFVEITYFLKDMANKHTGGKIVSVLEGGYALDALGRCVVAHLEALSTIR